MKRQTLERLGHDSLVDIALGLQKDVDELTEALEGLRAESPAQALDRQLQKLHALQSIGVTPVTVLAGIDPVDPSWLHGSMYRDNVPGTLCRPGWEPNVTTVQDDVTCPACRWKIDGGAPTGADTPGEADPPEDDHDPNTTHGAEPHDTPTREGGAADPEMPRNGNHSHLPVVLIDGDGERWRRMMASSDLYLPEEQDARMGHQREWIAERWGIAGHSTDGSPLFREDGSYDG